MLLYGQYEIKIQIQNPGKLNYNNTMDSKSQDRKVSKLLQTKLVMEKNPKEDKKKKKERKETKAVGKA